LILFLRIGCREQAKEVSMIDQLIGFVAGVYVAYSYLFFIQPIWISVEEKTSKGGEE
jgi:hypothetical protein